MRASSDGSDLVTGPAPDCLICDWRLPAGRNGLDVIRELRAAKQREIRALLISGETVPAAILAEAQSEHIDIARKPLAPARLRAWLASDGLPSPATVL